jgi:hypothetical protein
MSAVTYHETEAHSSNTNYTWPFDFTNDLPTAVTVSSASATHSPPSGAAVTPSCVVASPYVNVNVANAFTVVGTHHLTVTATLSDAQKVVQVLTIKVRA